MWILCLNDMRVAKSEHVEQVARAETKEELIAFLKREKVETYQDEGPNHHHVGNDYKYGKTFRKDGPLEWYNMPMDLDSPRHFINAGTKEEYIARAVVAAGEQWEYGLANLIDAASFDSL